MEDQQQHQQQQQQQQQEMVTGGFTGRDLAKLALSWSASSSCWSSASSLLISSSVWSISRVRASLDDCLFDVILGGCTEEEEEEEEEWIVARVK